jgi:hypothetical protein
MTRVWGCWLALLLASCASVPDEIRVVSGASPGKPAGGGLASPGVKVPPTRGVAVDVDQPDGVYLIAAGGQNLVGLDAGTLIGSDAGTLIGSDAGTLARTPAAAPAAVPGEAVMTSEDIGGLRESDAEASSATPTGESPPPVRPLAGTVAMPPGLSGPVAVYVQNAAGQLFTGPDGRPLRAQVDQQDGFRFPQHAAARPVWCLVPLGLEGGVPYGLVGLHLAGVEAVQVDAASTLVAAWLRARLGQGLGAALDGVSVAAWEAAHEAVATALADSPGSLPADWRPASVLAAVEALVVARPELARLLAALLPAKTP